MIGLDTTAIIDLFRGDPGMRTFLEKNNEPLATSMMNYLEIHFGIDPQDEREEAQFYEKFFSDTHFLHLTPENCRKASALHWSLRKKGKQIGKFDCCIAACLLEGGVKKILTRNKKHFDQIEELQVVTY
jgi:predicted nucleic acid-binding protein